ncbi:MAG: hypothetical protein Q9218_002810 [Villophora microphyllina]
MSKYSTMFSTPVARRGLEVILILVTAVVFYLASWKFQEPSYNLVSSHLRRQPSVGSHHSNAAVKSVAFPFGTDNYSPNFSNPISSSPHSKRDNAAIYESCKCKGQRVYGDLSLIAYGLKQSAGITFTYDQLTSAWTTQANIARFEATFDEWASDTIGEAILDSHVNRTTMKQDKAYTSVGGTEMYANTVEQTLAAMAQQGAGPTQMIFPT